MVCFGGVGAEEHRDQPRRHHRASDPRCVAPAARPRRADRVDQPAARRRRRRLRMAAHRCPAPTSPIMLAPGLRAGHRGTGRPRLPRAPTAPATNGSSATCSAPTTASPKSPQWAAGDLRAARRRPRRAGPPDGGGPHHGHGQLVAAAGPARRTGAVDGADAGRDARPDRAARRRFRPRLRLDERSRACRRCGAGCRRSRRAPIRSRRSSRWPRSATCCCTPASEFDYNGRGSPIPTSSACTGPAAIRSTTTRTSPGCGGRSAGSTPSSCTSRTGRRWPSTPTSSCRRPPRSNATTTRVRATTRC